MFYRSDDEKLAVARCCAGSLGYWMHFFVGLIFGLLSMASAAFGALAAADVTCTKAGVLRRVMVESEAPDRPLPCAVWQLSHPLEHYSRDWELLWRARNDPGFCDRKVDEYVQRWSDGGWTCVATREWRSTPFR